MFWEEDLYTDYDDCGYYNQNKLWKSHVYRTKNLDTKEICSNHFSEKTYDNIPIKKLLIANIHPLVSHKILKEQFSDYGEIVDCILKKKSGGKKNYAFITYSQHHEAQRAITAGYNKKISFLNQWVRVIPAASWNQPDSIEKLAQRNNLNKVEDEEISITNFVINESKETIHILNDDCLIHIFMYLPIVDRVRIERVCKHWKAVCEKSWHYNRTLDLNPSNWGLQKIRAFNIYKLLNKYGSYITTVDLNTYKNNNIGNATLICIAKLCPNIQTINIDGFKHSSSAIKALANNCNNIKKLVINMNDIQKFNNYNKYGHFSEANDSYTKDLSLLLVKNPKLQYFHLNCYSNDTKGSLFNLPVKSIKELILDNPLDLSDVYTVVPKLILQQLTIRYHKKEFNYTSIIKALMPSSENLKILQLCPCFNLTSNFKFNSDLSPISTFSNLVKLNLENNTAVDDDFLIKLSKKCKLLSEVNIDLCNNVTNESLKHVTSLPKLKVLFINDLQNISDEAFTHIPELQTLSCDLCNNISSIGLATLITTCTKLKNLSLRYCKLIDNDFIDTALEAVKYRTTTVLNLYMSGTYIPENKFTESPFLKLKTDVEDALIF